MDVISAVGGRHKQKKRRSEIEPAWKENLQWLEITADEAALRSSNHPAENSCQVFLKSNCGGKMFPARSSQSSTSWKQQCCIKIASMERRPPEG
ncbi:hypothetical protein ATANTOWER_011164 [Ataeniobius toweri]|uniref:Uncharacterized protein n=1 Tax=Ataeniobius toweri TaxID=208326 RepID=A0ABU7AQE1_9TELE|nr:hypothetical protein [Ataeniobius toweri]